MHFFACFFLILVVRLNLFFHSINYILCLLTGRPRLETKPIVCPTNGICEALDSPKTDPLSPTDSNATLNSASQSSSSPPNDSPTLVNGVHRQSSSDEAKVCFIFNERVSWKVLDFHIFAVKVFGSTLMLLSCVSECGANVVWSVHSVHTTWWSCEMWYLC